MPFPVIDAHQHVWDPARARYDWLRSDPLLDRAIGFDEVVPELRVCGVDATVLVQSADEAADTALMRETAERHMEVAAIVGFAPLDDPEETARTVEAWSADPLMVGVRALIHDRADPDWILQPVVRESLSVIESAGLSFDLVAVLPRHLEHVPTLSERHPDLRIVIDHLAKPPIGRGDSGVWRDGIARAAGNPLVSAKVSGLYSATSDPSAWTGELIAPFFDHAVHVFGADRLMYGGDWPISLHAGGYRRVWEGLHALIETLSPDERERVRGRTAARVYRIDAAHLDARAAARLDGDRTP